VADVLWVTDVFPAREQPIPGITGETVAMAARTAGAHDVRYHPSVATVASALTDDLRPGDVLVTIGAGSIESVGPEVVKLLNEVVHA
jgi:UDP-N-acetylmuramate--alanine ligase